MLVMIVQGCFRNVEGVKAMLVLKKLANASLPRKSDNDITSMKKIILIIIIIKVVFIFSSVLAFSFLFF